jgi:MYXO-CTERM domain-containing protein
VLRPSLAAALVVSFLTLPFSSARAQTAPISDCYYDPKMNNGHPGGRMVDAQPLMGTKRSMDKVTGNLHYLLYLPKGHDASRKWPVIVFLHGSGEINATGSMLNLLTKHSIPRVVEDPAWNWPFIVISPQIDNAGWYSHASEVSAVLDYVQQTYGGDPNRQYLTGLSYGGVGTLTVGIALADKWAALMPITPGGGGIDNDWAMRSKIVNMPIWFFNGKIDSEYNTNLTRAKDLEMSGAAAFYHYTYAFNDEYNDVVPKEVLNQKHVFGEYEMIGHDVWHATFGVYCPTLDAQKTTQYLWLLKQSKDGSAFVDPRGASGIDGGVVAPPGDGGVTPPKDGGAAGSGAAGAGTAGTNGAAGTSGAAGSGTTGAAGSSGAAGTSGAAGSDATGAAGTSGAAGSSTAGAAGTSGVAGSGVTGAAGAGNPPGVNNGSSGCGCATGSGSTELAALGFAIAALVAAARPRRRRR